MSYIYGRRQFLSAVFDFSYPTKYKNMPSGETAGICIFMWQLRTNINLAPVQRLRKFMVNLC